MYNCNIYPLFPYTFAHHWQECNVSTFYFSQTINSLFDPGWRGGGTTTTPLMLSMEQQRNNFSVLAKRLKNMMYLLVSCVDRSKAIFYLLLCLCSALSSELVCVCMYVCLCLRRTRVNPITFLVVAQAQLNNPNSIIHTHVHTKCINVILSRTSRQKVTGIEYTVTANSLNSPLTSRETTSNIVWFRGLSFLVRMNITRQSVIDFSLFVCLLAKCARLIESVH